MRAKKTGDFDIRCAELCGLFHGHMFDTGRVVSAPQFQAWIRAEQQQFAQTTPKLPPYSTHYNPEPTRRAG